MMMKDDFLAVFGFSAAMGASVVETPLSESTWFWGLTGNDAAFLVAFLSGIIIIAYKGYEFKKLKLDIEIAELKLKNLEKTKG